MDKFADLTTYCTFFGFPRSGHTLIGSLLDAHENIIIGHEYRTIKRMSRNKSFTRDEMLKGILSNSYQTTQKKKGRSGAPNYNYNVPNQHQGTFTKLLVIGDKTGDDASSFARRDPYSVTNLQKLTKLKMKYIYVKRNPFDIIARIAIRHNISLKSGFQSFQNYYAGVKVHKNLLNHDDIFEMAIEDFIDQPKIILEKLVKNFLELPVTEEYLDDCSKIVFNSPKKTRDERDWPKGLVKEIQNYINVLDDMKGYNFNS